MSDSSIHPSYDVYIQTRDDKQFCINSLELCYHIELLRQVIAEPEMTTRGKPLRQAIEDYCTYASKHYLMDYRESYVLPWRISWIWHVHRLHPVAYYRDEMSQSFDRKFTHERCRQTDINQKCDSTLCSCRDTRKYVPSIDLESAVIRQVDFLEKFKKHRFFSMDLSTLTKNMFKQMVQNYVSFLKLASKEELIVPTFDIDLIWHTHMRTYYSYRLVTEALCGFLLDHNDAIDKNILEKVYKRTADRWFEAYNTEYGKNINKNQLNTSQYASNCALVSRKKLVISSSSSETKVVKSNDSSKTAYLNDGHEGGGGSGDTCGDNGADGDGGGAGCAGCGDDGGGGDGGGAGCGGCGGGGC